MEGTGLWWMRFITPLNAELNPICHLLALLGGHHILHVSRVRVNPLKIGVFKRKEISHSQRK
jgi:hypothetical protein